MNIRSFTHTARDPLFKQNLCVSLKRSAYGAVLLWCGWLPLVTQAAVKDYQRSHVNPTITSLAPLLRTSTAPQLAQVQPSAPLPAIVQPDPEPVLPPPEELLEPTPDPPQLETPAPTIDPGLPTELDPDVVTIVVDHFEVVGSTVFSEAELQTVLTPFVGRPLTLAELLQARTAVTQLYVDAGYISSGAFIPPQEPVDGVVTIEVIEGSLVDIQVQGTSRLRPSYISNRLALAADPPLQVNRLVEALRLLQLDPLIDNISGDLSAGLEPGTNRLTVTVEEADSFEVELITTNDRTAQVGTWERGFFINEGNLSGRGDSLQLGYFNTNGSDRVIADYQVPINPRDGSLGFHFEYTNSQVVREPLDALDIETNAFLAELSFRQPIIQTPTEEFALSLTGSWKRNRTVFLEDLLGEAVPFPTFGADSDGKIEIFALQFAQDWVKRGRADVLAARSEFTLGLGGSNPTDLGNDPPDSHFFTWRSQAQWARLLGSDTLFLVRGEAQLASDGLPAQELFGLGGQRTVRGFRQNRLLTDNAVFATVEARFPILRYQQRQGLLQVVPFFDVGTGWNATDVPNPDPNVLVGTGIGLQLTDSRGVSARLDWGIPLNNSESGDSLQEDGLYFSIRGAF